MSLENDLTNQYRYTVTTSTVYKVYTFLVITFLFEWKTCLPGSIWLIFYLIRCNNKCSVVKSDQLILWYKSQKYKFDCMVKKAYNSTILEIGNNLKL